jgi:hypothetical protein
VVADNACNVVNFRVTQHEGLRPAVNDFSTHLLVLKETNSTRRLNFSRGFFPGIMI